MVSAMLFWRRRTLLIMKQTFITAFALVSLLMLPARAADIEWEPYLELGKDVFPSLLISTATVDWKADEEADEEDATVLGDANGWYGVAIDGLEEGSKVTVEISGDAWIKPSKVTVEVEEDPEGYTVYVQPKVIFDYDLLHQARQQKPTNMTFKVTVDGKRLGEKTETLILHELNDCPFLVDNGDEEEPTDLTWMFAAYVNENHPWIDGLLKEALQSGLVDSFTGYQSGDKNVVMGQVFAVWHTLQRRGIKYSDITTNPGSKRVYSQTVRFVEDTVDATQANCVDGSVLLASILRKIGLNVHLVMVPGHCYLAFDTDAEGQETMGLETTMIGNDKLKPIKELQKMPEKALRKEFTASLKTFQSALSVGTEDFVENSENFDSEEHLNYQLVPISEAREFGIMPLASAKGKK
jgi:hypothetical protein